MPLGDLFKSKQELEAESKKAQKRELRDATRSCDRLQADLDRQAKELESQIKAAAAKNDRTLAETLAKQLVKIRKEKVRAVGAKSKISSISSHANTIQVNNKLAQVMANSASAMSKVNQQVQPEKLAQTLNQFQAETTKMDMTQSGMNDMFDELFEGESDEADELMDQVLSELSIETSAALSKLPTTSKGSLATGEKQQAAAKQQPTAVKRPEQH